MSIFSDSIEERDVTKPLYFKLDELLTDEVEVLSADIVTAGNKEYGALETDSLVIRDILKLGETIRYTFKDKDGDERTYETKAASFYFAFRKANVEPGTKVRIERTGAGKTTRYNIIPVEKKGKQDDQTAE